MGSVFDGHGWSECLSRDGCVAVYQVGKVDVGLGFDAGNSAV